ncbi:MAG: OmpA family protein [Nitrospiraceae bacterium]
MFPQSCDAAKASPRKRLIIEGHCDERGSVGYNLVLGEKRAKAVKNILMILGVDDTRVKIVSYALRMPSSSFRVRYSSRPRRITQDPKHLPPQAPLLMKRTGFRKTFVLGRCVRRALLVWSVPAD